MILDYNKIFNNIGVCLRFGHYQFNFNYAYNNFQTKSITLMD